MATPNKILCRYYMNNCCTKGDGCPFSHDAKNNPDMTCRYYLMGCCSYGNACRYVHHKPNNTTNPTVKEKKIEPPLSKPIPGPVSLAAAVGLQFDSGMIKLNKDPTRKPSEWVKAPEFIPGRSFHGSPQEQPLEELSAEVSDNYEEYFFSYSEVAMSGVSTTVLDEISTEEASKLMCPFYEMTGICPWNDRCEYIHGEECDMCFKHCLNPYDPNQQREHKKSCVEVHEREMKKAFDVQRSEGQVCGICMEVVLEKPVRSNRRFGILSNCDHCFCLCCIRKWRESTHTSKKTIRACPLCRTISYLVIPSEVWITDEAEKQVLLESYKTNLCDKPCKYFNEGKGTCPFGESCLYKHAFPDGRLAKSIPRLMTNEDGLSKIVGDVMLWDFLQEREERTWQPPPVDHYWTYSDNEDDLEKECH